jgi:hypothetical protein
MALDGWAKLAKLKRICHQYGLDTSHILNDNIVILRWLGRLAILLMEEVVLMSSSFERSAVASPPASR